MFKCGFPLIVQLGFKMLAKREFCVLLFSVHISKPYIWRQILLTVGTEISLSEIKDCMTSNPRENTSSSLWHNCNSFAECSYLFAYFHLCYGLEICIFKKERKKQHLEPINVFYNFNVPMFHFTHFSPSKGKKEFCL